jgi:hypothetical protein
MARQGDKILDAGARVQGMDLEGIDGNMVLLSGGFLARRGSAMPVPS